jgi:hypothetical protein
MEIQFKEVMCPTCGETNEIEVEPMSQEQVFIQDCSVCCRPMQVFVSAVFDEDDEVEVTASKSE